MSSDAKKEREREGPTLNRTNWLDWTYALQIRLLTKKGRVTH